MPASSAYTTRDVLCSDVKGDGLDYLVACALWPEAALDPQLFKSRLADRYLPAMADGGDAVSVQAFRPQEDWALLGPLMARLEIFPFHTGLPASDVEVQYGASLSWRRAKRVEGTLTRFECCGPTPQVAVCRAFVAQAFGKSAGLAEWRVPVPTIFLE